jgi:hypothetical protein
MFAIVCAALAVSGALKAQGLPWYEVPVVPGFAGPYTCVTAPVGLAGATITCDFGKLSPLPPDAQAFLLAHEHGHVFQFKHGLQFASNPEADADCYAATVMATSNAQSLASAVSWLENVLGNGGGDMLHGTGKQVAAFARQCAAKAGVAIP